MKPMKPKVVELSAPWLVIHYIPRTEHRMVIARCNARVEAVRLMNAIATADHALTPCLSVVHENDVQVVTGHNSIQVPA